MKNVRIIGITVVLLLAGCGGNADPYHQALDDLGWKDAAAPTLTETERHNIYELMAAEVCGKVREHIANGNTDSQVIAKVLPLIDSTNPQSETAVNTLNTLLDHRCDASQPNGLSAQAP